MKKFRISAFDLDANFLIREEFEAVSMIEAIDKLGILAKEFELEDSVKEEIDVIFLETLK